MKKSLLSLLVVLCAALTAGAYTYDFMAGDLAYKINTDGSNTVSVTFEQRSQYQGWSSEYELNMYTPSYQNLPESVTIPSVVQYNGKMYRVTRIEQEAFWGCMGLKSISIPASVTAVEMNPFMYCYNLETITVAEGNTKYDSRDNCNAVVTKEAMTVDVRYINIYNGSEFTYTMPQEYQKDEIVVGCKGTFIPSGVTSIGAHSLSSSTAKMKSVVIPEGVTTVKEYAFNGCGMESLTLPASITRLGNGAFSGCGYLLDVYAYFNPDSVTVDPNPYNSSIYNLWDGTLLLQPYNHTTNLHVYPEYVDWYVNQPAGSPWEASDNHERFVVIGDLGQQPEEAYYITGSWDSWTTPIAMELNNGKWTVTKAMDANVEFKFKDQAGNWYGGQDDAGAGCSWVTKDMVNEGTAIQLVDGANFKIPVAGEWTFTLDPQNKTVVVSGEWNEPQPEETNVYILGEVGENNWAPNVGVAMDTEDHVTFTTDVTFDGRWEGYNYFSFTTKLAENADDWNSIAGYRFGAQSNDFDVTEALLGTELALQAGENAFRIPAGEYNLNLNHETMKLVITKKAAGKPGDANGDGEVNVNDVTVTINYILEKNPTPFVFENADVNGDGAVNVMDVTAIINLILNN